jgi:ankyrin repeat protein
MQETGPNPKRKVSRLITTSQKSINEEETKSSLKVESVTIEECLQEDFIESEFGSISEGSDSMLAQKVPHLNCAMNSHTIFKSSLDMSLYSAVMNNDTALCENILVAVPRPNIWQRWEDDNILLHIAAEKGRLDICKLLLDYADGSQISALNRFHSQPLHEACKQNHLQIAQLLVRSGAEINAADIYGNTPLHYASSLGYTGLVSWILTRNPNILIKNKTKKTAENLATKEVLIIFQKYLRRTVIVPGPSFIDVQRLNEIRSKFRDSTETISTQDFVVLKELGKGSFGEVFLVLKQDSGQLFAMKVLQKEKILKQNLIKYAVTERNVLSYIKHPFIVSLKYAFQTSDKLFLILDYCPGGDLASHLSKEKKFTEQRARIYISEIVLALEELHKRDIIYRDLKPDNIVLDEDGHALLTDFGLSKEKVYDNYQATSFCGSLAYLAPEVIKRQGHGKALDWYLLGVVLYEMIVGLPPYFSSNKSELFHNIQKGKLKIPCGSSSEVKDLIKDVKSI